MFLNLQFTGASSPLEKRYSELFHRRIKVKREVKVARGDGSNFIELEASRFSDVLLHSSAESIDLQ